MIHLPVGMLSLYDEKALMHLIFLKVILSSYGVKDSPDSISILNETGKSSGVEKKETEGKVANFFVSALLTL